MRAFGPVSAAPPIKEVFRAGLGAFLGLALAGAFTMVPWIDATVGLYLIAPFGATSVLLFAAPNSPLAQPWPSIVGNTASAAVGIAVCLFIRDPALRIGVAVGLAIIVMGAFRAIHPPGGAVAMTAALSPGTTQEMGFEFALLPVALGTFIIVLLASAYAHMTNRRYPFRQFAEPSEVGTTDPPPAERLGLNEEESGLILRQLRQSLNLGSEDMVRLVSAAELFAASRRMGWTASDIMSRDLVTVSPTATLDEVASLFHRHGFRSLPVVEEDGTFLGLIFQLHLLRHGFGRPVSREMRRKNFAHQLTTKADAISVRAADIMDSSITSMPADASMVALLPLLAEVTCDAVPIVEGQQIVGIVTESDMIAALARQSLDPRASVDARVMRMNS
jgi:CBS domain-containing membrane protein